MKKQHFIFLLAAMCLMATTQSCHAQQVLLNSDVQYHVKLNLLRTGFEVTCSFKANAQGTTMLQLPTNWDKNYIDIQRVVELPQNGATLDEGKILNYEPLADAANVIVIRSSPNAIVTVIYSAQNQVNSPLPDIEKPYALMVKPDFYYFISEALFAFPTEHFGTHNRIQITWEGIPAAWQTIDSFTPAKQAVIPSIKGNQFMTGVYWGGEKIRLHTFEVNQKPCYFATEGTWPFADTTLIALLKKTIVIQRAFWNDYEVPHYLVTLAPSNPLENGYSFNGRGLYNSFATLVTISDKLKLTSFRDLFHHELMHHWIGNQIINAQPEALMYWFSEGFTCYFTEYNMFQAQLISPAEYIGRINAIFKRYYSNPQNAVHNQVIQEGFFTDRLIGQVPYDRGLIFALYVDGLIQQASKQQYTLKDMMQTLLQRCKSGEQQMDFALFNQTLQQFVGTDKSAEIEQFIVKGEFLPLEKLNEALPAAFENQKVKTFNLGFTTDTGNFKKGSIVKDVHSDSPALAVGLRVGDKLAGISYVRDDVNFPCKIKVERDGEIQELSYLPAIEVLLPQLRSEGLWVKK